jgi:putative ABC transport system permease protein
VLPEFLTRLRFFLSRKHPVDLDDELQFHLEQSMRLNVANGMTPQEAQRQAFIAFGGVQRTREQCYEQRPGWLIERLYKDTRYVLRRLGRAPLFTAVALVTLALGIGATTAIFSVVEGVLIKPLPYPQADSLVGVWHTAPGLGGFGDAINCSPSMYFTYREESRTFQDFGLYHDSGATVTGLAEPDVVPTLSVTYGTLQALGVRPKIGRWFSEADDMPGAHETVILTYGYWQRRFGGDASVVGRTLTIDQLPRTVIGVMPAGFDFRNNPDLILPERLDRNTLFLGQFSYQGIARLKPGVTLQQANDDQARMLAIWLKAWPTPPGYARAMFQNARFGPKLQPFKQDVVGNVGTVLWVLMGTIGLVLLIACANVANLLLVRAESRQHEMAIRAALGAGWKAIAREMLLESAVLGLLGGGLGLGLAYGGLRILVTKGPETLPRLSEIGLDPLVLGFALIASLLAGLLFGLIPVLKYAAPHAATSVTTALRGVGRSFSQGRERHRTRNTLVVGQVALALMLLVGAGLMIRTFQALRSVDPGFTRPGEIQLLRILIYPGQVKEPEQVMRMQNAMLDKLAAIPGVTSVALAGDAPLEGFGERNPIYADDRTYGAGEIPPMRVFRSVSPGFFKTAGTPLIAGRDFTWTDLYEKRRVAIVSQNLAREMWGGTSAALGKRIRSGYNNDPWREVVGVTGDVYDVGPQAKPPAFAYWPALKDHFGDDAVSATRSAVFLVRTKRAATESFLTEARRAIWSVDAELPVFRVRTLKDLYDQSMARTSFTLVMLAIAGGMALVLGIVGIYGVIAYAVSQRTREIGIRVALGVQASELRQMFVREGLLLAGIGAGLGMIVAAGLTRLMSALLFGITPLDPLTYAVVPVFLLAAAALASYVPARRATIVNPVEALRSE